MERRFRVLKGEKVCEDIFDMCEKDGAIDINGEVIAEGQEDPLFNYDDDYYMEALRSKARITIRQLTSDPLEHVMADLILDSFAENEVAERLFTWGMVKSMKESEARVKWFMRKIEGWRRRRLNPLQ